MPITPILWKMPSPSADLDFDEVLFDGEKLSFEENIRQTKLAADLVKRGFRFWKKKFSSKANWAISEALRRSGRVFRRERQSGRKISQSRKRPQGS